MSARAEYFVFCSWLTVFPTPPSLPPSFSRHRFTYLFSRENPACEAKFLSGLIAHINEQLGLDSQGGQPGSTSVEPFYRNTLAYIRLKQQSPNAAERERFLQIEF